MNVIAIFGEKVVVVDSCAVGEVSLEWRDFVSRGLVFWWFFVLRFA